MSAGLCHFFSALPFCLSLSQPQAAQKTQMACNSNGVTCLICSNSRSVESQALQSCAWPQCCVKTSCAPTPLCAGCTRARMAHVPAARKAGCRLCARSCRYLCTRRTWTRTGVCQELHPHPVPSSCQLVRSAPGLLVPAFFCARLRDRTRTYALACSASSHRFRRAHTTLRSKSSSLRSSVRCSSSKPSLSSLYASASFPPRLASLAEMYSAAASPFSPCMLAPPPRRASVWRTGGAEDYAPPDSPEHRSRNLS